MYLRGKKRNPSYSPPGNAVRMDWIVGASKKHAEAVLAAVDTKHRRASRYTPPLDYSNSRIGDSKDKLEHRSDDFKGVDTSSPRRKLVDDLPD